MVDFADMAEEFLKLMEYFKDEQLIADLQELPNRVTLGDAV